MKEKTTRNAKIIARRDRGETYQQLSARFSISATRIRQICEKDKRRRETPNA
jgi:Mor family transcriptional regulator